MRRAIHVGKLHFDKLTIAFIIMLIVGSVGMAVTLLGQQSINRKLEERTAENRRALFALCAFQDQKERELVRSENFLHDNPNGISGISRELLQQSVTDQKRTLMAINQFLGDCS